MKLLTVGEVSRRTGLTVRSLHHGGTIGLLQPASAAPLAIAFTARSSCDAAGKMHGQRVAWRLQSLLRACSRRRKRGILRMGRGFGGWLVGHEGVRVAFAFPRIEAPCLMATATGTDRVVGGAPARAERSRLAATRRSRPRARRVSVWSLGCSRQYWHFPLPPLRRHRLRWPKQRCRVRNRSWRCRRSCARSCSKRSSARVVQACCGCSDW